MALHRRSPGGRRPTIRRPLQLGVLLAAVVAIAPCFADDGANLSVPRLHDASDPDGQSYSYYYVPRLSELNHLVGYLFRTGLVRKDAPEAAAAITRYAAYSCEGTLYFGANRERGASEDIDWSKVTALHASPPGAPPSLSIERTPPVAGDGRPLVLYVPDLTIRYQLHQALAVLVSECRPRDAREAAPRRERRGD